MLLGSGQLHSTRQTEDVYADLSEDVEMRFDISNYQVDKEVDHCPWAKTKK